MRHVAVFMVLLAASRLSAQVDSSLDLPSAHQDGQRNVIFILCDDHRSEALGFLGHAFLETPHLDRMASGGAYLKNAFVTTSFVRPVVHPF